MIRWLIDNKEWLFGGIGVTAVVGIIKAIYDCFRSKKDKKRNTVISKHIEKEVDIKELTSIEKNLINKFYNVELKRYILSPVTLPLGGNKMQIVNRLIERNILNYLSSYQRMEKYNGMGVPYTLTIEAVDILNKLGSKKYLEED